MCTMSCHVFGPSVHGDPNLQGLKDIKIYYLPFQSLLIPYTRASQSEENNVCMHD